jgi:peptidoglycan/LPS O-acetylase OafA/YrhL
MRAGRFAALDAWRGICALFVALRHLHIDHPVHHSALVQRSSRFVDFFFVLSGFVIAHAYRDRLHDAPARRTFLWRRVGRLWPLHMVTLVAMIGFELAGLAAQHTGLPMGREPFVDRASPAFLPFNALLMHGWGFLPCLTWNQPSWSISTELVAYGAFALLCTLPRRSFLGGLVVLLVPSLLLVITVAPFGIGSTYDFGLARCLFGFTSGVLVRAACAWRPLRVGTAGEIGLVLVVFAAVALLPRGPWATLVTPLFALVVWAFASEQGAVSRLLRQGFPQRLGLWSYSIYMIHSAVEALLVLPCRLATTRGLDLFAVVHGEATIVGGLAFTTVIVILYVALVISLAALSYRYIELPGQAWFARLEQAIAIRVSRRAQRSVNS